MVLIGLTAEGIGVYVLQEFPRGLLRGLLVFTLWLTPILFVFLTLLVLRFVGNALGMTCPKCKKRLSSPEVCKTGKCGFCGQKIFDIEIML